MNIRWILIIFGITLITVSSGALEASQEFSLSADLQPLKLSYEDVKSVVEKISGFLKTSNGYDPNLSDLGAHSVQVTAGELTISVKDDLRNIDFSHFPNVSYELTYKYYDGKLGNSITQVSISLSDYRRTISITGNRPDQVEALFAMLINDLNRHRIWLGGLLFRTILAIILALLCGWLFAYLAMVAFLKLGGHSRPVTNEDLGPIAFPLFVSFSIFFSWVMLGIGVKVLPAFAIFAGEVSWLRRYSAEISFYGLLVTIILFPIVGWLKKLLHEGKNNDNRTASKKK
ncbi:MAG: hypothetical protein WC530_01545 [Candidatus Omnitrophota bacterium]|jgi:ABC-type Na+ efflux pump permease subunit